jgi:hypothetical protein
VKTFDDSKIPKVGGEVTLTPDVTTDPEIAVTVKRSRGLAEVLEVAGETGERGLIAFQPDGSWWWIRKIDPRDPWGSDPEAWKGNGGA